MLAKPLSQRAHTWDRSAAREVWNESRNAGTAVRVDRVNCPSRLCRRSLMDGIIYLVGLIVVIMVVLSFLGLH
jgi:hypothetical protein